MFRDSRLSNNFTINFASMDAITRRMEEHLIAKAEAMMSQTPIEDYEIRTVKRDNEEVIVEIITHSNRDLITEIKSGSLRGLMIRE